MIRSDTGLADQPVIAALDLGSNTFRLMLAAPDGPVWRTKEVHQQIPRLSERLALGKSFAPEALDRAWAALSEFDEIIKASGAVRVLAGATMAARLAADGPWFMEAVGRRFGWETAILSSEEEARLTATGVLTALDPTPPHSLIFDIGGRSTEFITAVGRSLNQTRSLPVGVVILTEAFLGDPIAPGELNLVERAIKELLAGSDFSDVSPESVLVGTAGTVTTVAALLLGLADYDPDKVNNARLTAVAVARLLDTLAAETVAQRIERHGLHPRRADAIVAGLVLVLEIMKYFGREELVVSDNGLLEGLWLKAAGLI